jgi:hypothetical protein
LRIYLGLAPKFLMHAIVTGSLHGMKVFIGAIKPFTVECRNNRPVCNHAGLIEAFTVIKAQELRQAFIHHLRRQSWEDFPSTSNAFHTMRLTGLTRTTRRNASRLMSALQMG